MRYGEVESWATSAGATPPPTRCHIPTLRRDALVHGESSRVRVNNASRTIRGGTRVDATMASSALTWKRFWRGFPLVHTVRLQGMIATGRAPGFGPQPLNLESVERHLASAFSKKVMPDAVAITVNSPGGSPVQCDLIYTRICALAKETGIPVFTFAEDVAASGGYYLLAAGADGVYCRDTSIVPGHRRRVRRVGFVDAIKRLGVERRVYASGRSKVQLDPFLPEKEEDLAARRRILENIHASFRDVVLDARGEKLTLNHERAFSGEVFTGREAVEHGLCDAVGEVRGVMPTEVRRASRGPKQRAARVESSGRRRSPPRARRRLTCSRSRTGSAPARRGEWWTR